MLDTTGRRTVLGLTLLLAGLLAAASAPAQTSPQASGAAAPPTHAVAGVPAAATKPPSKGEGAPAAQRAKSATSANSRARPAQAAAQTKRPRVSHYHPDRFARRAGLYYGLVWGVDDLVVRWGESGEVIRVSYRVLDADKAKTLNDKKNEPALIDPRAGVKLVVPSMENVGQLRQSAPPENGKSYWMVFSNKGRLVRRGDHVNLVIGPFHADRLVVD